MIRKGTAADDKELRSNVEAHKKAVEMAEKELELRAEALAIQRKYPKCMKPNFEFETTDEWETHIKKQWQFAYEKQKSQIDFEVERLKVSIEAGEKQLAGEQK